jgi:hypothetical protein
MWWSVTPTWLPWLLGSLAGLVAGFLIGFWMGGKDRAAELRTLRIQLAESDAAVRQLYAESARRTARQVTGDNDAA